MKTLKTLETLEPDIKKGDKHLRLSFFFRIFALRSGVQGMNVQDVYNIDFIDIMVRMVKMVAMVAMFAMVQSMYGQCGLEHGTCPKCKIKAATGYQTNAMRIGSVTLPDSIDGKKVNYKFEHIMGMKFSGVSMKGNTLTCFAQPKGKTVENGRIHILLEGDTTEYLLPVKVAADDEMYGYLYCHMSDRSECTLYALGTKEDKGEVFHPLIDNQPVFDPEKTAKIEGGARDAFILRGVNDDYVMVNTDMSNAKTRVWNNYGIDLMHSNDMVHWTSRTFDFRKFPGWENVNRVWAPQILRVQEFKGYPYFIYYSMLTETPGDYDKIYYSYANEDFTELTPPQLLYDKGISVIDCHIDWNDCDKKYHVFYKKEGAAGVDRGIWAATIDSLPSADWHDTFHITNEGKEQVEGPSAFRLINENVWKVAYIKYSGQRAYRVCTANAVEADVDRGVIIRENVHPQHGSFMQVTQDEYEMLEAWSKLTLKYQDVKKNGTKKETKRLRKVLDKTFKKDAIKELKALYEAEL